MRLLVRLVLILVSKTALLRNKYVFTVNIVDNYDIVQMIGVFCENIEVEEYSSLFERYSRSPKAVKINIEIYTILCRLLTDLIGYLVITFKFPKDEVSQCNIFQ